MRGGCNLERRLEVGTRRAAPAGRQHRRARWTALARSWSTQSSSRPLKRRSVELLPKRWQSSWPHLTCSIHHFFCARFTSQLFQAILARSRSRERAAEAQQRRRLQRPKTRVVLSTSASKGSYRILQEEFSSLGNSLGRSYQRLGHQTELDGAQLQLRSYSYSTPEALQKTQEDGFLFWTLTRLLCSLQSSWFSPFFGDQPPAEDICYSYHVYDFRVYARICLAIRIILMIYQHILSSWDMRAIKWISCKWNLRSVKWQSRKMRYSLFILFSLDLVKFLQSPNRK